jgi:hypothetical protein
VTPFASVIDGVQPLGMILSMSTAADAIRALRWCANHDSSNNQETTPKEQPS